MDRVAELETALAQACADLNAAHDELMKLQGADPGKFDWAEWSSPANTIRWAERLLGRRLAKTNAWTEYPSPTVEKP